MQSAFPQVRAVVLSNHIHCLHTLRVESEDWREVHREVLLLTHLHTYTINISWAGLKHRLQYPNTWTNSTLISKYLYSVYAETSDNHVSTCLKWEFWQDSVSWCDVMLLQQICLIYMHFALELMCHACSFFHFETTLISISKRIFGLDCDRSIIKNLLFRSESNLTEYLCFQFAISVTYWHFAKLSLMLNNTRDTQKVIGSKCHVTLKNHEQAVMSIC